MRGASWTLTTTSRCCSRSGSSSLMVTLSNMPRLRRRRWLSRTRSNEKGSPGRRSISRATVTSRVWWRPARTTLSTIVRGPGSTTSRTRASVRSSESSTSGSTPTSRKPRATPGGEERLPARRHVSDPVGKTRADRQLLRGLVLPSWREGWAVEDEVDDRGLRAGTGNEDDRQRPASLRRVRLHRRLEVPAVLEAARQRLHVEPEDRVFDRMSRPGAEIRQEGGVRTLERHRRHLRPRTGLDGEHDRFSPRGLVNAAR